MSVKNFRQLAYFRFSQTKDSGGYIWPALRVKIDNSEEWPKETRNRIPNRASYVRRVSETRNEAYFSITVRLTDLGEKFEVGAYLYRRPDGYLARAQDVRYYKTWKGANKWFEHLLEHYRLEEEGEFEQCQK